ncbi:Protein Paox [Echinococcus multilocularis]|uniref:Protein Paox n=1 Tax=Echinococcus multilocularis TaxID=6211 RepID=A0A0S4MQN2_ECHMU|nr:Protein Paox [Echinococcus multilocularis]
MCNPDERKKKGVGYWYGPETMLPDGDEDERENGVNTSYKQDVEQESRKGQWTSCLHKLANSGFLRKKPGLVETPNKIVWRDTADYQTTGGMVTGKA